MMGPTHSAQGVGVWLAGCVASTLAGWPPPPEVVVLGTVTISGAALLPDCDHRSGTLANVARPLSSFCCDKIAILSAWSQRATATKYDRFHDDGHRGLTHTGVAGLVAGLVATLFAWLVPYGPAILVGIMVAFAGQAILPAPKVKLGSRYLRDARLNGTTFGVPTVRAARRTSRLVRRALLVWTVGAVAGVAVTATGSGGWWLGPIVGLGWLTHLAGDMCSVQGVPLWWPAKVRWQRWRMVGLWYPLRIKTGGRAERFHLLSALAVGAAGTGLLFAGVS